MCAVPYPSPQGYYSSPYHLYYNSNGQYCAYDPNTGNHFIHNLKDKKWYYSYVQPTAQPAKQYHKQPYASYTRGNEYSSPEYDRYPRGIYEKGGVGCGYDGGHVTGGERNREHTCRSHGEGLRYSATFAEAAPRSQIGENNIEMPTYFEDEGVDVHMGERSGRPQRHSNERQRQRSRSGPARKEDTPYRGASSSRHRVYHCDNSQHLCQHQHIRVSAKQGQEQTFGSNQAGVGCEGSEHDSGYMGDFNSEPEPRRSMPGVAKWLDNTPSEFSGDDGCPPFDTEYDIQCDPRPQPTKKDGAILSDPLMDKSGRDRSRSSSYRHRIEFQAGKWYQKPYDNQVSLHGDSHKVFSSRALHRQDSGIDIQMDTSGENDLTNPPYPSGGYLHGSSPKQRSSHSRSPTPAQPRCEKTGEVCDYYYTIPPCPNLPPPVEAPEEAPAEPTGVVYRLERRELSAPLYLSHPPPESPTFCQPDSIYTSSVVEPRQNHYHYDDYTRPPKAPSPPPTPALPFAHRARRSAPGAGFLR